MIPRILIDKGSSNEADIPIPPRHLWVGYDDYLSSGKRHVDKMLSLLNETNFFLADGNRALDFGWDVSVTFRTSGGLMPD